MSATTKAQPTDSESPAIGAAGDALAQWTGPHPTFRGGFYPIFKSPVKPTDPKPLQQSPSPSVSNEEPHNTMPPKSPEAIEPAPPVQSPDITVPSGQKTGSATPNLQEILAMSDTNKNFDESQVAQAIECRPPYSPQWSRDRFICAAPGTFQPGRPPAPYYPPIYPELYFVPVPPPRYVPPSYFDNDYRRHNPQQRRNSENGSIENELPAPSDAMKLAIAQSLAPETTTQKTVDASEIAVPHGLLAAKGKRAIS